MTMSHDHLLVLLRASAAGGLVLACVCLQSHVNVEKKKESLFLIYPEGKSHCALQAMPT